LLPYILFEKYIYIFALETASPGNQHCASCIGTLLCPTALLAVVPAANDNVFTALLMNLWHSFLRAVL